MVREKPKLHQVEIGLRNWSEILKAWTVAKIVQGKVVVKLKSTWKMMEAVCMLTLKGINVGLKRMRHVFRVIKREEAPRKD